MVSRRRRLGQRRERVVELLDRALVAAALLAARATARSLLREEQRKREDEQWQDGSSCVADDGRAPLRL